MELTKEYFDKGINNVLEKVTNVKTGLEGELSNLEAKMEAQTVELKHYTKDAFEAQQEWMEERFGELIVKYDVRERVVKLEKDVASLKLERKAHA